MLDVGEVLFVAWKVQNSVMCKFLVNDSTCEVRKIIALNTFFLLLDHVVHAIGYKEIKEGCKGASLLNICSELKNIIVISIDSNCTPWMNVKSVSLPKGSILVIVLHITQS